MKQTDKNNTHCFVAGRSGGHIIPALTYAQQVIKKNPETKILFFSTSTSLDKKITATANIDWHVSLTLENVPYKKLYRFPIFFWNFSQSFFSALYNLKKRKPRSVVSTGGYISIPICLAARLLRIPVELFELNVIPGKTTKFLAPISKKIHVCFEKTKSFLPKQKCTLSEYPQRFSDSITESRETLLKKLGFSSEKKTVLILGGSQGSLFINNLIKNWIEQDKLTRTKIQIIHQTGAQDKNDWNKRYKKYGIPAITAEFFKNVQELYQVTDLVVCRAGSGSLFETLFLKKPCITIPLETAKNDHQVYNAQEMQKLHPEVFTVIRQTNADLFFNAARNKLFNNPQNPQ